MLKAILFDLDDTLLGNSMDTFVPAYFQALTRYVAHQQFSIWRQMCAE